MAVEVGEGPAASEVRNSNPLATEKKYCSTSSESQPPVNLHLHSARKLHCRLLLESETLRAPLYKMAPVLASGGASSKEYKKESTIARLTGAGKPQ